jgi:hypothetical protein
MSLHVALDAECGTPMRATLRGGHACVPRVRIAQSRVAAVARRHNMGGGRARIAYAPPLLLVVADQRRSQTLLTDTERDPMSNSPLKNH